MNPSRSLKLSRRGIVQGRMELDLVNNQIETKEAEWLSLYESLKVAQADRAKASLGR